MDIMTKTQISLEFSLIEKTEIKTKNNNML